MIDSRIFLTFLLIATAATAADGGLDGSFGNYLPGVTKVAFDLGGDSGDYTSAILVQGDDKLVLVGSANTSSGSEIAVARLTAAGVLDSGFASGGKFHALPPGSYTTASANAAALQPDGRILVAGAVTATGSSTSDFIVCRLTTFGAFDATFGSNGCTRIAFDLGLDTDVARAVAIQPDGKVVVAGDVAGASAGFGTDFGVARLLANGLPDSGFGFGGTGRQVITRFDTLAGAGVHTVETPKAIVVQSDGNLVIAGTTKILPSGDANMAAARLDSTGQLDATYGNGGTQIVAFDIGSTKDDGAEDAVLQRDGQLVLMGSCARSTAGDFDFAVARLTTGGVLDTNFAASGKRAIFFDLGGVSASDSANAVALQSDGKILSAGRAYNTPTSSDDIAVARLLANGALDSTFDNDGKITFALDLGGSKFERATGVAMQNGRIVVGGDVSLEPASNRDFIALRLVNDLIFADRVDF